MGLARQASGISTEDTGLQEKALEEACKVVSERFSADEVSVAIAARIHEVVKKVTGNRDPYRAIKERELKVGAELYPELRDRFGDGLEGCLRMSAVGNSIDFFREPEMIAQEMGHVLDFAIDDSSVLRASLGRARKVLFLADNAGELCFDLPLVKWIQQSCEVVYVVKPEPVQDDTTLVEVREAGLELELGRLMTTGVASPGVILSSASASFRREFEAADLVFAKGMGHYEALSELPREGRFFHCLRAKCGPVAESIGVPVDSYVLMRW